MSESIPQRPDLDWYRKLAKKKLRGLRADDVKIKLADAQLSVAREHGFASWKKLVAYVDAVQTARRTVEYYDAPSRGTWNKEPVEYVAEYDRDSAPGGPLADLVEELQLLCGGKRVLEVAAGHGRWTRYIADVAEFILATDSSPRQLEQAQTIVHHGRSHPPERVKLMLLDAYEIDRTPGNFDVAVVINWLQHVPQERQGEFLQRLHRKVCTGGTVLIGINHFGSASRARLFRKGRNDPNVYERRTYADGSTYDIVDYPYTREELMEIGRRFGRNVRYHSGRWFYWMVYQPQC